MNSYGFENDLRILTADVLDIDSEKLDEVQKLLVKFGIRPADVKDIISHHIFPIHDGEKWKDCDDDVLIGHVRFIKENIDQYLHGSASASSLTTEKKLLLLQILGNNLRLKAKSGEGNNRIYEKASHLYLGDEYLPTVRIEEMLGDKALVHSSSFLSVDYLNLEDNSKNHINTELIDVREITDQWRSFFFMIGVADCPRILRRVLPFEGFDFLAINV